MSEAQAPIANGAELARRWAIELILARAPEHIGEVPLEEVAHRGPEVCLAVLAAATGELDAPAGASGRELAARLLALSSPRSAAGVAAAAEALRRALSETLPDDEARTGERLARACAGLLQTALELGDEVSGRPQTVVMAHDAVWAPGGAETTREERPGPAVIVDERDGASAAIEVRDQRRGREQGPAAWLSSISRQLERWRLDGSPFAVLVVEVAELAQPAAVAPGEGDPSRAILADEVERALGGELGAPSRPPAGDLASSPWRGSVELERPGRWWLLAPELDREGAERLAERLVRVVAGLAADRGRAPAATVGVSSCPTDGTDAAALASHADASLYAARTAAMRPWATAGRPF